MWKLDSGVCLVIFGLVKVSNQRVLVFLFFACKRFAFVGSGRYKCA